MSLDLKQLLDDCNCTGKSNGVAAKVYYAPLCDFDAIGDIDAAETDIDEYGVIDTAHTFLTGKGFIEIALEDAQNKLMMASNGEKGFGNFKTTFEGLASGGYNRKIRGFANQQKYCKGIAIAVLPNGKRIQIGGKDHPAYLKCEFDTTTSESSDPFGFKLTLDATTPLMYEYKDALAITLHP